jgi:uncharacterized protein (DUF433 family)
MASSSSMPTAERRSIASGGSGPKRRVNKRSVYCARRCSCHEHFKPHRDQSGIMLGKPVIRGTRITVELLLRSLSEGATEQDLLEAYPHLTHEDIQAAIAYAADAVGREKLTPLDNRA